MCKLLSMGGDHCQNSHPLFNYQGGGGGGGSVKWGGGGREVGGGGS